MKLPIISFSLYCIPEFEEEMKINPAIMLAMFDFICFPIQF